MEASTELEYEEEAGEDPAEPVAEPDLDDPRLYFNR
jgi:hypothetical protein